MNLTQEKNSEYISPGPEDLGCDSGHNTCLLFKYFASLRLQILPSNTKEENWVIYKWLLILLWFKLRNLFVPWGSGLNPQPCACWAYGLQMSYPCNKESFVVIIAVIFFETGSHYVAWADLELKILLPQPPKYWMYRHVPPHLASNFVKWFSHLPHRLILFNKFFFAVSFLWVLRGPSLLTWAWWRTWAS